MKKKLMLLAMTSVFALTACHGTKKVEFKEFGEEVNKTSEENKDLMDKLESVKVSGKVEDEKFKAFTVDLKSETAPELDDTQKKAYALGVASATVYQLYGVLVVAEGLAGEAALKGMTFFIGNGFKVVSENEENKTKSTAEFEKRGLLVSLKATDKDGKKTSLALSWKVAK